MLREPGKTRGNFAKAIFYNLSPIASAVLGPFGIIVTPGITVIAGRRVAPYQLG
jgi:hypothetical protein